MTTATAIEVQKSFERYLQMAQSGDEIIITKDEKEIARLVPYERSDSFLTDSLLGVLKNDYDEKEAQTDRMQK